MEHIPDQSTPEPQVFRNGVIFLLFLGLVYGVIFQLRPIFTSSLAVLITLFLLWLYTRKIAGQFTVQRCHQSKALEDQFLTVQIVLTNRSLWPAFRPSVVDFFSPDKAPFQLVHGPAVMWPGAQVKLSYKGVCFNKRGHYKVGPARIIAQDPFGVFSSFQLVADPEITNLLVLPATELLSERAIVSLRSARSQTFGEQSIPKAGQSLDFHGLREYRPGDPSRFIHWPLSAHRNRLLVKQFDRSQPQQTLVFLCLQSSTLRGLGRHSTHEYAIRAAASFVQRPLQKGQPAALFGLCQKSIIFPPRRGLHRMPELLEQLANTKPIDDKEAPFWNFLSVQGAPYFKSRFSSHTILVLPTIVPNFNDILDNCQTLVSYGHSIQIHFISGSRFLPLTAIQQSPESEFVLLVNTALKLRQAGFQISIQKNGQSLQESLSRHSFKPIIRVRPKSKKQGDR
jgi:uncharacterized protein (DUF58 family)